MDKYPFQVITGGLLTPLDQKDKVLESAYTTDTRLMGALAVHAHWHFPKQTDKPDLHQFFYIDCEEDGLETYNTIHGDDSIDISQIQEIEQSMFGGLGAKKIALDERELAALISFYARFNKDRNLPLPDNSIGFRHLTDIGDQLTPSEQESLMSRICGPIHSNYQLINYFLLRCFGQDYRAASRLVNGNFPLDIYKEYTHTSFCKNVIDKQREYEDGTIVYICESLVERNGQHELVVSQVVIKDMKVIDFSHCSGFKVSSAEAAMMLSKPEFVTVYEVLLNDKDIEDNIGEFTITFNTIMTRHTNGRLFMSFKDTNAHVDSDCFMVSNDVNGIYYLTDFGQLIVASYSLAGIRHMENKLSVSPLASYIITTAKYEFQDPILYEFINSGIEDFDDFINMIKE